MILSNYWKILKEALSKLSTGSTSGGRTVNLGVKNIAGDNITTFFMNTNSDAYTNQQYNNFSLRLGLGVRLGTGTTPPTKDDYALAQDITTSLSNISMAISHSYDNDNGYITTFTITGQNNSGSEVTINEYGIYKDSYEAQPATGDSHVEKVLFIREVLDSPITVPNGYGFKLDIEWKEE